MADDRSNTATTMADQAAAPVPAQVDAAAPSQVSPAPVDNTPGAAPAYSGPADLQAQTGGQAIAPQVGPAPAPANPGRWHDMVKGALTGFVNGGVVGAVIGAADPKPVLAAQDRRVAEQNADIQKKQSDIRFTDANAAATLAEAHQRDKQVEMMPEQLKEKIAGNDGTRVDKLLQRGVQPAAVTKGDSDEELQAALQTVHDANGAVPALSVFRYGRGYMAFLKSDLAASPGFLNDVNETRAIQGANSPLTLAAFNAMPKGAQGKLIDDANHIYNPKPVSGDQVEGMIAQYKGYIAKAKLMPNSEEIVGKLQAALSNLQDANTANIAKKDLQSKNAAKYRGEYINSEKRGWFLGQDNVPVFTTYGDAQGKGYLPPATVDKMYWGRTADGSQIAGTMQEMQKLGAQGVTKLPGTESQKVLVSRQLVAPDGLFMAVKNDLDRLSKQGKLGLVASRWSNFMAGKVGNDPEFASLRASMGLLGTALQQAHVGAKGSDAMLEHFKSLADYRISDEATLRSALRSEFHYVTEKAMLPKAKAVQ